VNRLCFFLATIVVVCSSFGQDHEFVVAGMWNRCESIQSGECHVTGLSKGKSKIDYRFVFDFPEKRFKFESECGKRRTIYCRNELQSFRFTSMGTVILDSPDKTPPVRDLNPWDFRILGLLGFVDQFERKYSLEDFRSASEDWKEPVLEESDGLNVLRFESMTKRGHSLIVKEFTVDPQRDYAPVRMRIGTPEDSEYLLVESEFSSIGGLWLATRCIYSKKGKPQADVKVQWNRINEPINQAEFTPEGMGLPTETRMVSQRKDGTLVEDRAVQAGDLPGSRVWTASRLSLLLSTVVLTLAIGAFVYWRR
jgi:hypothetical protein